MLNKMFIGLRDKLYVQIWENRIKVTNIKTGAIFDEEPLIAIQTEDSGNKAITAIGNSAKNIIDSNTEVLNPFSHPRTLLADFICAEKILQDIFRRVHSRKWVSLTPLAIIHLMEKTEGGLTQVEVRSFRELASGAGCHDVAVYQGSSPIISHQFDQIISNFDEHESL